jgi:hypothetical protein
VGSTAFSPVQHTENLYWINPISCVHSVILVFLIQLCDQSQNLQNCLNTPRPKNYRRGGGLRQVKSCRKVPFKVTFHEDIAFCLVFNDSYFSMIARKDF